MGFAVLNPSCIGAEVAGLPALMNLSIPLEVFRNGLRCHVLYRERGRRVVQFEFPVVVGRGVSGDWVTIPKLNSRSAKSA